MNRDELIAYVPVHEYNGRPFFVRISEIPEPWQTQFSSYLASSQCPMIEGERNLAYVWDWERWVHGR
ncbi:hypothetical protein ACO0LB_19160 [Undibacterium sp. SXout7W]|uniref:hypothetical protein n=1 Tax=Undibacterium sp. SXout7W TaxID=3413049 RepID=UPI003BF1DF1D